MRAGSGGSEGVSEQGEARGSRGGGQGSPPLKLGPIGTQTGAKAEVRRCPGGMPAAALLLPPPGSRLLWFCSKLGAGFIDTRQKKWPLLKHSSMPTSSRLQAPCEDKGDRRGQGGREQASPVCCVHLGLRVQGRQPWGSLSGSWSGEESATAGGAPKADGGQSGQGEEGLCPSVEDFRAQRKRRTLEILMTVGVKRGYAGAQGEEAPHCPLRARGQCQ